MAARTFRYRVTAQTEEGRFQTVLRAAHPIDAALAVMEKLGFGEDDPFHPPLALFVVPLMPRLVKSAGVSHG